MNEKYEITSGTDSKGLYIRIRSINKAKHFAVYRTYTKRTNGNEENVPITTEVIDQIIKSIEKKGITEGFILNLAEKKFDEKENKAKKISPDDVRHQLSKKEINCVVFP